MDFWIILYVLLFFVALVATGFAGAYTIMGSLKINSSPDSNLATANRYLIIASVVCWVTVALILVGVIALFFIGFEVVFFAGSWIAIGFAGLTLVLAFVVGALSAAAAVEIRKSAQFSQRNVQEAYTDSIIAAIIGVGVFGLVIVASIIYFSYSYYRKYSLEHPKTETTTEVETTTEKPEETTEVETTTEEPAAEPDETAPEPPKQKAKEETVPTGEDTAAGEPPHKKVTPRSITKSAPPKTEVIKTSTARSKTPFTFEPPAQTPSSIKSRVPKTVVVTSSRE
jgi:hypothetical protein